MLRRLVTCSKNTPSELVAGEAATLCSLPSRKVEMVADSPSPSPSIVTTAQDANPDAHAAPAACASWWSTSCSSACPREHRASSAFKARLLSPRDAGPGAHSVILYFKPRVSPADAPGAAFRRRTA